MEITYTTPHPVWFLAIGVWLGFGVLGVIAMAVADRRAERLWGLEPYVVRPDWVLGGPLALAIGAVQLFMVIRAARRLGHDQG